MAVKKDQNPKLRIKLKSYDVRMLESAVGKVISLLIKSGAQVKGPIPLPKKERSIQFWDLTLNSSLLESNSRGFLTLE